MIKCLKSITAKMVLFELLFKFISFLIAIPIFYKIVSNLMVINKIDYLTKENIYKLFEDPHTFLLLGIGIFVLIVFIMFNIFTTILVKDMENRNETINIKKILKISIIKTFKSFSLKNIIMYLYLILLLPILFLPVISCFLLNLPILILESNIINANLNYVIIGLIIYLISILFLIRWIFAFNYYVLEDISFIKALKMSKNLIKKNKIKDYLGIIGTEIMIIVSYIVIMFIECFLIVFMYKIFNSTLLIENIKNVAINYSYRTLMFYIALCLPFNVYFISCLFYRHKEKKEEAIILKNYNSKFKSLKNVLATVAIIVIILDGLIIYSKIDNSKIKVLKNIELTAHRGASKEYPENTFSAFKQAYKLKADWIELDVKQTKDKQFIVIHDGTLKRVAKINKRIIDVNYGYLKNIDVGSFLDKKFSNERIPLLEDVVIWAKINGVKLNIELKPYDFENDFEYRIIDIINKYDYGKECIVAAKNYEILENIKKYDPKIKTVYVMSTAYGNIANYYEDADIYSVKSTYITKRMVTNIHNHGKEIYAWTIDTKDEIEEMINLNIDSIITNDIRFAKKILDNKDKNLVSILIHLLVENFEIKEKN